MKTVPISSYFAFGQFFRHLANIKEGRLLKGKGRVLYFMNELSEFIDFFDLQVTKRAAHKFEKLKRKWRRLNKDHVLSRDEALELRTILKELETTLVAEAEGKFAYIVSDKRMNTDKLLNDVSLLFRENVFSLLPDLAQFDFRQAGKCIAFELHTAGAFHLLRGTEAILRFFYRKIVKIKRVSPPNWGPIVSHLRKRKDAPPKELLQNLDNIRESFRNPTQHPEKAYDTDEVQDLFGLCVEVVNRMILYIAKKKYYKKGQGSS